MNGMARGVTRYAPDGERGVDALSTIFSPFAIEVSRAHASALEPPGKGGRLLGAKWTFYKSLSRRVSIMPGNVKVLDYSAQLWDTVTFDTLKLYTPGAGAPATRGRPRLLRLRNTNFSEKVGGVNSGFLKIARSRIFDGNG